MIEALFSPHWYRVKDLKPQLKKQVQLVNQEYRGQIWHVVRDPASTRSHRFSSNAYEFVRQFDGQLSVEQIWASCNQRLGDDSPSQDELIALLSKLHTADLMQSAVSPALEELLKRGEKRDKAQRNSHFKNPAALRFPLFDPDQFLERTAHWVRPAFAGLPLATIFVLVIIAAVQAGAHWSELSEAITTQALQPYNLLLLVLLYPLVKLLHELGHAYSVKLEGGEVHELGVMLLVLMPIPYVDASASSAFPERHKRVLVSAAGMIVELALSAMAMLLWLTLENGIVRDIALNIVLIGGVSTLLFNGNPLLRYDAYYMLSDSVGIPNLAQRSNQYLGYLIQRYVFGIRQARSPASAEGEAPWFVFYAISSFFYRTVLMLTISLYLAGKMFFLGVMLALWMLFTQFVLPLAKMAGFHAGIGKTGPISVQHFNVSQHMMAPCHRLRCLQVRKTGHDPICPRLGLTNKRFLQSDNRRIHRVALIPHPKAEIDGNLVVARSGGVQTARRFADQLFQSGFHVHMNIFKGR